MYPPPPKFKRAMCQTRVGRAGTDLSSSSSASRKLCSSAPLELLEDAGAVPRASLAAFFRSTIVLSNVAWPDVQWFGLWAAGLWIRVCSLELRFEDLRLEVWGLGFRVWGSGCRV